MFKFPMVVVISFLIGLQGCAEDTKTNDENIETLREQQIERWDVTGIVTPKSVTERAEKLFSLPVEKQSVKDLELLAKKANAAANYVTLILDEYKEYYSDNYQYESIQRRVVPYHDAYADLFNKMANYRNKAYFNLGKKYVKKNEPLVALFYFRDAYRLSKFDDVLRKKGLRYMAEYEMKKLLGIEKDIDSFVHWR